MIKCYVCLYLLEVTAFSVVWQGELLVLPGHTVSEVELSGQAGELSGSSNSS